MKDKKRERELSELILKALREAKENIEGGDFWGAQEAVELADGIVRNLLV